MDVLALALERVHNCLALGRRSSVGTERGARTTGATRAGDPGQGRHTPCPLSLPERTAGGARDVSSRRTRMRRRLRSA